MNEKRIRLKDRTLENDIKFKGILSYRHFRIIAWIFLALAQIAVLMTLEMKINPSRADQLRGWRSFFSLFTGLPVSFFLIANFACIIQKRDNLKKAILFYGMMALGMYVAANFVIFHYFKGIGDTIEPYSYYNASRDAGIFLPALGKNGYVFNIFNDLFVCTLMYFFLNYEPQKHFQGKNIPYFRLFIILPLLYELAGAIIKYFITFESSFVVPSYFFFLLPGKPPFMVFAFLAIILALKYGENYRKKKYGESNSFMEEHLKTNAHSLRVSIFIAFIFLFTALLDLILTTFIVYLSAIHYYGAVTADSIDKCTTLASGAGFGGSIGLLLTIPFVLIFSYRKKHENVLVDRLIPVFGIALIVVVYAEGLFDLFTFNVKRLMEIIEDIVSDYEEEGGEGEPQPAIYRLITGIKSFIIRR